jgi:methyl-accepting chemotaxis protein
MTTPFRTTMLFLAVALAPRTAHAAVPAATSTTMAAAAVAPPSADALTAQERDMLAVAGDLARKCSETIEKWLTANEVSEDRLWSGLYYPIEHTDPPKFNTDWDRLSDRDILALEEAALARSAAIVYAVLTDRNGYIPTHNTRYAQTLTGSISVDWVNNRTKRIFNNHVEIAASRNTAPFLFQRYFRDNGDVLMDLGVPVMVRGKHFGAIRLGFRPAGQ